MSVAVAVGVELEPERRPGRWAALAAGLSVGAFLGSMAASSAAGGARVAADVSTSDDGRLDQLQSYHDQLGGQALATALRSVSVLLAIGVGVWLYWLVKRRGAQPHPGVLVAAVVGPILVVVATVFWFAAWKHVSDGFYAAGPRTAGRAGDLVDDSSRLTTAGIVDAVSRVVFAVWVGALSLYALRLQLLTSLLGYWGFATAGVLILQFPVGDALYIGWLASLGFLAYGVWPGGRPEAWTNP